MNYRQFFSCLILFFNVLLVAQAKGNLKVIYAINAGSHEHTDQHGITYEADPLIVGTASDYGNTLMMITRVPEHDEVLYRTERYHTATFGYDLPVSGDGDYALILKFCEVYFEKPNKKVFDITLNRQHTVVNQLDIFREAGKGCAHDEYVFFSIMDGHLFYKDEESEIIDNMIRLEFVKSPYDNPKINAFVLLQGDVERIPRLMPLPSNIQREELSAEHGEYQRNRNAPEADDDRHSRTDTENGDALDEKGTVSRTRTLSGPRKPSPYIQDDSSSMMLPVCIAIGAFIPLLFCLCKL